MKKSAGFTLLELVVVIVVLGILAVSAAPRFLNIKDKAQLEVVNSAAAAIESASDLGYAGLAMYNLEKGQRVSSTDTDIKTLFDKCGDSSTELCTFTNGYASNSATIMNMVKLDGFSVVEDNGTDFTISPDNISSATCAVYYDHTNADNEPTIRAITSGC